MRWGVDFRHQRGNQAVSRKPYFMNRLREAWVTLNRRPRRGTRRVEVSVFVLFVIAWWAFSQFVYAPDVASTSRSNTVLRVVWTMISILAYQPWVVWYRNRHPVEAPAATGSEQPLATGALPPGMTYPSDWQDAWLQRQRERRRSRSYPSWLFAGYSTAVAIIVIGFYTAVWQIAVVGLLVIAVLVRDWWRYSPRDVRPRP
jgi:hypothetical protein